MKKAVIVGERQATLVDVPEPQPVENWVVVKIHAAPMCAEEKQFVSGEPADLLGHEAAGEVVAVAQEAFECSASQQSAKIILQPWA